MAKAPKNGQAPPGDGEGHAQIYAEMMKSPAFKSLSAGALRVLLWCVFLNFKAASKRVKGATGRPVFTFTNADALTALGMPPPTFSRAKSELAEKGFLRWHLRGGLKGVNGVPSEYALSGAWKEWTAPTEKENDMSHARAAKQRHSKRP